MSPRRIKIFDTTLRDGEQSPGCSMNLSEKLEVAKSLVDLGVDIIEAGFPIASPGDFEAVKTIADTIRGVTVCGLARCSDLDIERAWESLKGAEHPRIHVFLATSAIHREFKLKMTQDEIIAKAVQGVKKAHSFCDDIEFSPEDAARTEIDFLCKVVEAVIDAGATTINIPDTVGYTTPKRCMIASRRCSPECPIFIEPSSAFTATMIWEWPSQFARGRAGRCRANRMHHQWDR